MFFYFFCYSENEKKTINKYKDIYCKNHDFFIIFFLLRSYNNEKTLINQS